MSMKKIFLAVVLVMVSQIASGAPFLATAKWSHVTTNIFGESISGVTYVIEEKRGIGPWVKVVETGENIAFIQGNATAGEIITYRAAAIWQGLYSEWSNEAVYTVPAFNPNAPNNFSIIFSFSVSPGPNP